MREEKMTIDKTDLQKRISSYINYELQQNSEQAYLLMQCIELILELKDDEKYYQIVEDIYTYDLRQNVKSALMKLKAISLAIDLETTIENQKDA